MFEIHTILLEGSYAGCTPQVALFEKSERTVSILIESVKRPHKK